MDKKPPWLKKKINLSNINISQVKNLIDDSHLHTVCQSAKCPNIFECFGRKISTFMLMGDRCTRNCRFCGVISGNPLPLDKRELERIAKAVKIMGLGYAVITSVTRDDLPGGGAAHFARTVTEIKKINPGARIECLVPDFGGNTESLKILLDAEINVLNHNLETVKRRYGEIRSKAKYRASLDLLKKAKRIKPGVLTKSGFMVGLGERLEEIRELLQDLKNADCDIVTIGQYLRPSAGNIKVAKYYTPEEFRQLKTLAETFKFKAVSSGIFVRSSYGAEAVLDGANKKT